MRQAPAYSIWEIGSDRAPPGKLTDLLAGDERLLWSATLSSRRLLPRYAISCFICLGMAGWMATVAPWGENVTDYCARAAVRNCRTAFYLIPFVGVLCAGLGAWFFREAWQSRFAPVLILYGLTTDRALRINGWNPGKVRSRQLRRGEARIDYYGDVQVDGSRSGFVFTALDKEDARRAVYWANVGRFDSDGHGPQS